MENSNLNLSYTIKTFGCQMNVYDSDRMEKLLAQEGCHRAEMIENAELIILNTCTVREKARHKVLSQLGKFRPLKKKNRDLIIAVAGCVAQQEGRKLLQLSPVVDIVMGPDQVDQLPGLIRCAKEGERVVQTRFSDEEQLSLKTLLPTKSVASAFVTVGTGCNKKCSFCVVPSVRGVEKCRHPEEIINECKSYLEVGAKEIILIGQTVNAYEFGSTNFPELLKRVHDLKGLERLRFITSHPVDMTDEIINCFGELEHLCENLHLPIQSGSNSVLKRMIRRHKREDFLEIVSKLRKRVPNMSITTDIIVGFPGETEEEFEDTMSLLQEVKFDGSFSFIYSPRPGAPSTRMKDQLGEDVKKERHSRHKARQDEILFQNNKGYEGREVEVLVEGPSKADPRVMTGRTRTNKLVHFPAAESTIGELVQVKILKGMRNYLRGY
ncbi:tRNA (N6-isopentenyl adenosine(37)-C2)-methylthiotransferase MiaB [Bdellovibrionota bacterium]